MQTVQKEADKKGRKIQLNFTQFIITKKRENNQQKPNKNKNKTQRVELAHSNTKKQLTVKPVTRNGKIKITIGK